VRTEASVTMISDCQLYVVLVNMHIFDLSMVAYMSNCWEGLTCSGQRDRESTAIRDSVAALFNLVWGSGGQRIVYAK
jgi:hypothetical protein